MKHKNNFLISLLIIIIGVILIYSSFCFKFNLNSVKAQTIDPGLDYLEPTGLPKTDPRVIVVNIIKLFLGFLGLFAVIMIMYAGFLWMTAGGNSDKIDTAKAIIKNAFIGILIILSSYAIVSFIFNWWLGGGGNSNFVENAPNGGPPSYFVTLGENIVESHYPARNEKNVPRNTKIVITFREPLQISSVINGEVKQGKVQCGGENNNIKCGQIKFSNIRIFPSKIKDSCKLENDSYINCEKHNVVDVSVETLDAETFVFRPKNYLGNAEETAGYTVYLSRGLQKADGKGAFGANGNYEWDFEVSTKLDLTPPKIINVFPSPDDAADNYTPVASIAAQWKLTVNDLPSAAHSAAVETSTSNSDSSKNVETIGIYAGTNDGNFYAAINENIGFASVKFNNGDAVKKSIIDNKFDLGYGLTFRLKEGSFGAGNSWDIKVLAAKEADSISIDDIKYIFGKDIEISNTTNGIAVNIVKTINGDIDAPFSAEANNNTVILTAKKAGASANSINISLNNDKITKEQTVTGRTGDPNSHQTGDIMDQPINAVIQINFDEPIDPIIIDQYVEIKYAPTSALENGGNIAGEFLFSNQYRTIEFKPHNSCGTNSCGETMYCLPKRSQVKVELKAGNLILCVDSNSCKDNNYSFCNVLANNAGVKVCKSQDVKKNYPLAESNSGVIDMCDNSLDGNGNGNADSNQTQSGKLAYNLNNPSSVTQSDDVQWFFYTSDILDLTAPEVITRSPRQNDTNLGLDADVTSQFNKLMMSSSLKTGTMKIDGKTHNLINLESNDSSKPVGYWITKEDLDINNDEYPDQTKTFINHDLFVKENLYRSKIGSGVKDIYQNCYNPNKGVCPNEDCDDCCTACSVCD